MPRYRAFIATASTAEPGRTARAVDASASGPGARSHTAKCRRGFSSFILTILATSRAAHSVLLNFFVVGALG